MDATSTRRRRGRSILNRASTEQPAVFVDLSPCAEHVMQVLASPAIYAAENRPVLTADECWLRERYAELVPAVLPDMLCAIGEGRPMSVAVLDRIRELAERARGDDVDRAVVLRAQAPAIRAFATLLQTADPGWTAQECTVLVGRAAILVQEAHAHWMEAWEAPELAAPSTETVAVVAVDGEADPALQMVGLAAIGQSTEQIAAATDYSTQAVKWHLGRLMRRWNAENRAALVTAAFLRGFLVARRTPPRDDH
ncbi:LuxR C-terminal-related transcriptional regulator [Microbacterium sp. P07]|uniref:helix-turn-helix transcriptional regulator n=1 Tax=Microbacterium sp. P07 TaxID=3366952 RepID=UPI003745D748